MSEPDDRYNDSYADYDESSLHEDCVPADEALSHVLENDWDEVQEAVEEAAATDWLESGRTWLDLLNIVSRCDRDQLRDAVRLGIFSEGDASTELSPAHLFTVASEICKSLESSRSPYAARYQVGEDLEWVGELVELTRAFRELLLALGDLGESSRAASSHQKPSKLDELTIALERGSRRSTYAELLKKINAVLEQGMVFQINGLDPKGKGNVRFARELKFESTTLSVVLAKWMMEYLTSHMRFIQLAVCVECGRTFARERRDNVYCSKTCQNRVAYKRKKVFEAGVLREIKIHSESAGALRRGLCVYHPRLGLGVLEAVSLNRRIRITRAQNNGVIVQVSEPIPEGETAEQIVSDLRNRGEDIRDWKEQATSMSVAVRVRFLSTVRTLRHFDLFGRSGDSGLTFYSVEDAAKLAEML